MIRATEILRMPKGPAESLIAFAGDIDGRKFDGEICVGGASNTISVWWAGENDECYIAEDADIPLGAGDRAAVNAAIAMWRAA